MNTIFMIEDDDFMTRMYGHAFKESGFTLEFASDGEEALSKLKKTTINPSLIMLDVMMPKKDGFDVLTEIKKDDKLKNIPVVVFTNMEAEDDAKKALGLGASLYLVKSQFDPKEVVEKVRGVISPGATNA